MIVTITLMADFVTFAWRHAGPPDEISPPLGGGTWDSMSWSDVGEDGLVDAELRKDLRLWHARFEGGMSCDDQAPYRFDWQSFHADGIALCQRLRKIFGQGYRIRYEKPMEDPACGEGWEILQIETDGTVTEIRTGRTKSLYQSTG
jgi:hypothetical protein